MDILEQLPATTDALIFTITMLLVFINSIVITGHFPRETRSFSTDAVLLVLAATTLSALAANTLLAIEIMSWFAIVILAGSAFLFAPLTEQQLPVSWRRRIPGLVFLSACSVISTGVTLHTLGTI
ncbi:hypothetical protein OAA86_09055 [Rhodospirillales bacterium]|nr:hypothetical protein [Rhodospirillales bacterium]